MMKYVGGLSLHIWCHVARFFDMQDYGHYSCAYKMCLHRSCKTLPMSSHNVVAPIKLTLYAHCRLHSGTIRMLADIKFNINPAPRRLS